MVSREHRDVESCIKGHIELEVDFLVRVLPSIFEKNN